jgi:hypothetical protein
MSQEPEICSIHADCVRSPALGVECAAKTGVPHPAYGFVPATRAIGIGASVFYRPIRAFSTGVFAGENLTIVDGDRSGCVIVTERSAVDDRGLPTCHVPKTVTHRVYWHAERPGAFASAFLSYPNGMGALDQYFWEARYGEFDARFTGPFAEIEMEVMLRELLVEAPVERCPDKYASDPATPCVEELGHDGACGSGGTRASAMWEARRKHLELGRIQRAEDVAKREVGRLL